MAERIRVHMFISDGQLTAARNAIKDSLLDPRGGGLNEFSIALRRVGGGGGGWNGASWVMEREGLTTISFELFVRDIIESLNMQWNTGAASVQVVTYIHEDEFPTSTPREGFEAALADTVKKPWALERVPDPLPK